MPYDFFGGSGLMSNRGTVQIPMLYTLLVGGEVGGKRHVVLVDAGFGNQEWMSRYQFFAWEDAQTVLAKVDLKPEDVDRIFVTHLHFGHIGNFQAFPDAHLYIQLDEYMGWLRTLTLPTDFGGGERSWGLSSLDLQDLHHVATAISQGKVTSIEGEVEVLPGIMAYLAKDSTHLGLSGSRYRHATELLPLLETRCIGLEYRKNVATRVQSGESIQPAVHI
jgi:hypothetical protein